MCSVQFYLGGISDPWSIFCNPDELDHGVLIVGYGKGIEYMCIVDVRNIEHCRPYCCVQRVTNLFG